ncbi:MAG: hypothetical protein J5852_07690 [Clostridia bacterium]|nr:hypothetical protein [Clostridia bacterium]
MKFTINLAKVNIEITSIYEEVYTQCTDYLCDNAPDFKVEITPEDITFEREKSKREAAAEHIPYIDFKDSYLETLAVYRKIATNLLDFNAFLMHGAVVGLGGKAYMFTAPSGVGKSTHIRFWLETFKDAFIINGDKPILKFEGDKVYACGTPWAGKEGLNKNVSLPLCDICILTRGTENEITPIPFSKVYPLIIQQTYRPYEEDKIIKTMQYIKDLGEKVNFYLLKCNLQKTAAQVAFDGMKK